MEKYDMIVYGAPIFVISLIVFILYGVDKKKAKKQVGVFRNPFF